MLFTGIQPITAFYNSYISISTSMSNYASIKWLLFKCRFILDEGIWEWFFS